MGLLKKSSRQPEPTPDSLLGSAFSTVNLMLGRVFETQTQNEVLNGVDEYEPFIAVGFKTWEILQKAAAPIFSDAETFQFSQRLAISQQLSPALRQPYSQRLVQHESYEIARPQDLEELVICLSGIRTLATQRSGLSNLKNPDRGCSQDIAFNAGDIAMKKSFEWVPCFLNESLSDWNSQKRCEIGKPHLWEDLQSDWKTSIRENQFFTMTVGLGISTYNFDPIRSIAASDGGGALNWIRTADRGFELVARMLSLYKQQFAQF